MSVIFILVLCSLIILAYLFEITLAKFRIPSVIFLLFLGWTVRKIALYYDMVIPDLSGALAILGTVGLILIVLEGAMELELNKKKFTIVKKSFIVALFPMLGLAIITALLIHFIWGYDFYQSLGNIIPIAVISSSVAIPSAKSLSSYNREFVVYESSMSDIMGVILFNFISLNAAFSMNSVGHFFIEIAGIIVISFVATLLLSYLLGKIEHEVKFVPIIVLTILIYEISKLFHLPSLVFIMVFGLFLANLDELKFIKGIEFLKPVSLNKEVARFLGMTKELTFLIKTLFFLLFGFLIKSSELFNTETLILSIAITLLMYVLRYLQLRISKLPVTPLLFVAPRGLITVLLFLSIPVSMRLPLVNNSMIIQIIVLTGLIMMFGLMATGKEHNPQEEEVAKENNQEDNMVDLPAPPTVE